MQSTEAETGCRLGRVLEPVTSADVRDPVALLRGGCPVRKGQSREGLALCFCGAPSTPRLTATAPGAHTARFLNPTQESAMAAFDLALPLSAASTPAAGTLTNAR